ncbi:unnamed protein product [Effrenium voratum]|uniref:Uncharacterized protein n=1 Tax=Effrenium voratum TaxID=2562239 RepID=A0AA36N113_9DINO|nr:unnamed protein product [Effrenium voratum]
MATTIGEMTIGNQVVEGCDMNVISKHLLSTPVINGLGEVWRLIENGHAIDGRNAINVTNEDTFDLVVMSKMRASRTRGVVGVSFGNPKRYTQDDIGKNRALLFDMERALMMCYKILLFTLRRTKYLDNKTDMVWLLRLWMKGHGIEDLNAKEATIMFCTAEIHYMFFRLAEVFDIRDDTFIECVGPLFGETLPEMDRIKSNLMEFLKMFPCGFEMWNAFKRGMGVCNYVFAANAPHSIHARNEKKLRRDWCEELEKWNDRVPPWNANKYYGVFKAPDRLPELDENFGAHGLPKWYIQHGAEWKEPPPFESYRTRPAPKPMPRSAHSASSGSGPAPAPDGGRGTAPGVEISSDEENEDIDFGNDEMKALFMISGGKPDNRWKMAELPAGSAVERWQRKGINGNLVRGDVVRYASSWTFLPYKILFPVPIEKGKVNHWEKYLRKVTTCLLAWHEPEKYMQITKSYGKSDNAAWLKLYAYLCQQTSLLECEFHPGARQLKALVRAADNLDNEPMKLKLAAKIQAPEHLCDCMDPPQMIDIAARKMGCVLMLDWPLRGKSNQGKVYLAGIQLMSDLGWGSVQEFSEPRDNTAEPDKGDVGLLQRIQHIINVMQADEKMKSYAVHLVVSMLHCIDGRANKWIVKDGIVWSSLDAKLKTLAATTHSLVSVYVNHNAAFHGATGDLGMYSKKFANMCREKGFLVTDVQYHWDAIASQCVQMSSIVEGCVAEEEVRFNVPPGSDQKRFYKYDPPPQSSGLREDEKERTFSSATAKLSTSDEEDKSWFESSQLASGMFCENCKSGGVEQQMDRVNKDRPESCINCAANSQADFHGYTTSSVKKNEILRLFVEMCGIVDMAKFSIGKKFPDLIVDIIKTFFRTNVAKPLSHLGYITMDQESFEGFFGSSRRGKQLVVEEFRCKVHETKEIKTFFRIGMDYGNVCYAGWWRSLLSTTVLGELFSSLNAELLGDGFEMLLGFFEVLQHFETVLPQWGKIYSYKRGLEISMINFANSGTVGPMKRVEKMVYAHPVSVKVMAAMEEEYEEEQDVPSSGSEFPGDYGGRYDDNSDFEWYEPDPEEEAEMGDDDPEDWIGNCTEEQAEYAREASDMGFERMSDYFATMRQKAARKKEKAEERARRKGRNEKDDRHIILEIFDNGIKEAKRRRICLCCQRKGHHAEECEEEEKKKEYQEKIEWILSNVRGQEEQQHHQQKRFVAKMYEKPISLEDLACLAEGGMYHIKGELLEGVNHLELTTGVRSIRVPDVFQIPSRETSKYAGRDRHGNWYPGYMSACAGLPNFAELEPVNPTEMCYGYFQDSNFDADRTQEHLASLLKADSGMSEQEINEVRLLKFGILPPWSAGNYSTTTWIPDCDHLLVVYVPALTLVKYDCGLTENGTVICGYPLHFSEVEGMWIVRGKRNMAVENPVRVFSRHVVNEICVGFRFSTAPDGHQQFIQNMETFLDKVSKANGQVQHVATLLEGLKKAEREMEVLLINEYVLDIRKELGRIFTDDGCDWEDHLCRVCPACVTLIPAFLTLCVNCKGRLLSVGKFIEEIVDDGDEVPEAKTEEKMPEEAKKAKEKAMNTESKEEESKEEDMDEEEEVKASGARASGDQTYFAADNEDATDNEYEAPQPDGDDEVPVTLTFDDLMALPPATCLNGEEPGSYIAYFLAYHLFRKWRLFESLADRDPQEYIDHPSAKPYAAKYEWPVTPRGPDGVPLPPDIDTAREYVNAHWRNFEGDVEKNARYLLQKLSGYYHTYKLWRVAMNYHISRDVFKRDGGADQRTVVGAIMRILRIAYGMPYVAFTPGWLQTVSLASYFLVAHIVTTDVKKDADMLLVVWCVQNGIEIPEGIVAPKQVEAAKERFRMKARRLALAM